MALLKTRCPECNAGLKSPTGFAVGQTVCCPKCETYFAVEEPEGEEPKKAPAGAKGKATDAPAAKKTLKATVADDDDDDDAPKKKKKKKVSYDEDEEGTRSYKNSPLRFVVLGVLVVVMLVMGYFLYDKRKKEAGGGDTSRDEAAVVNPRVADQNGPKLQPIQPGLAVGGPKQPDPGGKGGAPAVPFGLGLGLGGDPALTPAEIQKRTDKFKTMLVGTWVADLGGGVTEELTYTANGTFTTKLTGPAPATLTAKYTIKELVGTKGVKIQLDTGGGTRTVVALLDGDELEHPSLQEGVTGTFRKK